MQPIFNNQPYYRHNTNVSLLNIMHV